MNTQYVRLITSVVGMLALNGCVNVGQLMKNLSEPPMITADQVYMVSEKQRCVTTSSEWDWVGVVAASVGAGAAGASVPEAMQSGIILGSSSPECPVSKQPAFASISTVDVVKLFQEEGRKGLFKHLAAVDGNQSNRIVLTPYVNVLREGGDNGTIQCFLRSQTFVDGKSSAVILYRDLASTVIKDWAINPPTPAVVETEVRACLGKIVTLYSEHVSGALKQAYAQGMFKPGVLMYTAKRGQKNDYYLDNATGLVYGFWSDGVEIARLSDVNAFKR